MRKKIVIASFLFINLLFIGVIVYGQIKIRQIEKARQEAQEAVVGEEVGVTEKIASPFQLLKLTIHRVGEIHFC
jgi:hypothetical protein